MNREELAYQYHEQGFNCCQAVVAAFSDVTGLTEQQALAVGGGFGGGMRCGEVCGAISGAIMVLGMANPYVDNTDAQSKKRIANLTREFHKRFKALFTYMRCTDLLRADFASGALPQGATAAQKGNRCAGFVCTAVRLADEMLEEEKQGLL